MNTVASLPAKLRARAKASELRGHHPAQWCEGVRFAANQIEAALATPEQPGSAGEAVGYLVDSKDFYYLDFPRSEWGKHESVVPVFTTPPPAPSQGTDRIKVLEMFLGRIFAAQQLNESGEYKGWKISGRGSLNEVVAEAREYLNCPLGAVDMPPPAPAAEQAQPEARDG